MKKASDREPQLSKTSSSRRYKTDARIAKKEVPYQEGHHLIPIKAQKDFEKNIDRPENIVCLCPICHRAVHNAKKEERIEILKKLYDNKIDNLKRVGIDISFEDLFNKYYV